MMNHAQPHTVGLYQPTPSEKATAVARAVGGVRPMDATPQRQCRNTKGQKTAPARSHAADGFLKSVFLPKLEKNQTLQDSKETAKTERDFYTSLSQLVEHYRIAPMPTQQYGYPYKMVLALWEVGAQLKHRITDFDSLCLLQDKGNTFLLCEERYNTGSTLYYIPVAPLYHMLRDPKRKASAHLLLSVCAYLYHIADIPYYRQGNSYLYWMYEMMADWIEQDEQTEETAANRCELEQAALIGDCMEKKMYNPENLNVFENRLRNFKPRDAFDRDCLTIAREGFALYQNCPNERVYRNIPKGDYYGEGYEDNEIILMDKYVSFIADTKGWLYERLSDFVNNEFNEYGEIEEPAICKSFDGKPVAQGNLDFENRLFTLMDNLCGLLYNYEP
ncbi:hypothetical protein [Flavobacterium sp.]|uniref:hypothetical protein n=1 Tax=Flavobacterium sp. TaxID=239 RepID=UPI003A93DB86